MIDKKDGGVLIDWQLHTLATAVEDAQDLGYDVQTNKVFVLTGTVKEDPTGRWEPGYFMRSSIIVALDVEAGWVETQNTFYKIEGPPDGAIPDLGNGVAGIYF